ncbi:uncharacterized protein FN964_013601 [Alca torda]
MPAASMTETLQLPALQVPEQQAAEGGCAWSSSSTPTLRRRRFKMRRMKNVQEQSLEISRYQDSPSSSKEYLQLPSIEITPSSDEDTPWSNCSTPSASPRRKRFLLRKWLRVREKKEYSESSSQQSSQQSSHDDELSRFLSPHMRDDRRLRKNCVSFHLGMDSLVEEKCSTVFCSLAAEVTLPQIAGEHIGTWTDFPISADDCNRVSAH